MILAPFLVVLACAGTDDAGTTTTVAPIVLEPPPADQGFQMTFEDVAPPFTELWRCKVETLPITELAPVSRVESRQTADVHHMDIMAIGLTGVQLDEGMYDCGPLYEQYPEFMEEGIFLYSSQVPEQEIQLPEGVVATVPAGLQIMFEVHYVNYRDTEVKVESKVNAWNDEDGEWEETIWGSSSRDTWINLPPRSEHTEWNRCVMNTDIDLLFLSSHTHELGLSVDVYLFDGVNTGELIYTNDDWHAPALMSWADTPLHVPTGQGFEFHCNYKNPWDHQVNWGFTAADEMCQIAIVHTPGVFGAHCDIVETSDGVVPE